MVTADIVQWAVAIMFLAWVLAGIITDARRKLRRRSVLRRAALSADQLGEIAAAVIIHMRRGDLIGAVRTLNGLIAMSPTPERDAKLACLILAARFVAPVIRRDEALAELDRQRIAGTGITKAEAADVGALLDAITESLDPGRDVLGAGERNAPGAAQT